MGHKVHPTGYRLGVIKDWQSKWYSDAHYAEYILEDNKIREYIKSKYAEAAISLVELDRQGKEVTVTLHTARPGIVIGRGGQRVDEMRQQLETLIGKKVRLNIQEIRQPELDAYLVARSVAEQIERRVAYRRAMKQSIFRSLQSGAKGIKISAAGRLAGAEIARRQTMHEGQVPLHTLRADIDYGFTEAVTTMGRIGIKVWIYKGQILPELKIVQEEKAETADAEAAVVETAAVAEAAKVAPVAEVKPVVRAPKAAPAADNRQARAPKAAPAPTNSIVGEKLAEATAKAKAAAEEKAAKPKAVKKAVKPAEEKEPEVKAAKPKAAVKKAEPAAEEAEAPKKKIVKKAEAAPETAPKAAKKATTKSKEEGKDATA